MRMSKEKDKPKIFQGWFVVIACFFVTMSLGVLGELIGITSATGNILAAFMP